MLYSPKVGMLSSAVRELSDIVEHMGPSPGCEKCSGGSEGETAKVEFKLHASNESYDKLVIMARQSEARLRVKGEEVVELQSKVNLFSNYMYYYYRETHKVGSNLLLSLI